MGLIALPPSDVDRLQSAGQPMGNRPA
eukprot:COSAG01_NODE_52638_length_345_cov_0.821138_1_plen_26_part_01